MWERWEVNRKREIKRTEREDKLKGERRGRNREMNKIEERMRRD